MANSLKKYVVSDNYNDFIEFLNTNEFKKSTNLFFNLEYDTNAIIKQLPINNIIELANTNETMIDDNHIKIIPKKLLQINRNRFFDLWQFFKYEKQSSLDAVSKKYLNESKIDVEEITGIKKDSYKLEDFYNTEIIKYCIDDCVKTYKLGTIIAKSTNEIGLVFNSPYSCATLSIDYFYKLNGIKTPAYFIHNSAKNKKVMEYGFYSYNGGRFEMFKKGYFNNNIYEYDVNNMYPFFWSQLQDIYGMDFMYCKNEKVFEKFLNKDTFYAILKIEINQKDEFCNILPYRKDGLLIYPNGKFKTYITYPELQLLDKYNIEYNIIDGYIGLPNYISYPYKDIIHNIYNKRKMYDKDNFLNSLYKIISNSGYGKFLEINLTYDVDDDNEDMDKEILDMVIDDLNENIICKNYQSGKYTNFIYGSYITSMSRCFVTDIIKSNNKDNIICSFVDSIISDKPLKNIKVGNELGEWEKVKYKNGVFIGTGLYYLSNEENKKIRTRGFHFQNMNDFNFYEFLEKGLVCNSCIDNSKCISCEKGNKIKKSSKLKESVKQDNINDFNLILEKGKGINLNFDTKRNWKSKFTDIKSVYNNIIDSIPISI